MGVTCANGNVFVATSRGYLIRHYWDEYGGDKVSEIEVTKQTDVQIGAVFVDSSANHILIRSVPYCSHEAMTLKTHAWKDSCLNHAMTLSHPYGLACGGSLARQRCTTPTGDGPRAVPWPSSRG